MKLSGLQPCQYIMCPTGEDSREQYICQWLNITRVEKRWSQILPSDVCAQHPSQQELCASIWGHDLADWILLLIVLGIPVCRHSQQGKSGITPPSLTWFTISYHFFPSCSHACVIRGQVITSDGTPLVGVNISFANNPLFGYTISRQDGRYGFCYTFYSM